jgi:signal transduction histidine kinase/CheY-like chemotaxis protein
MQRRLLRLDEDRVLLEQLKLLLGNVGMSVIPTVLLSAMLFWTLRTDSNAVGLAVWVVAVNSSKLINAYHARQTLKRGLRPQESRALVWTLMALNAVDGVAWGVLPWVTLNDASVVGTVLVIAVMAGVTSNAMSVLAPVLPVFLAFCVCALVAISVKLALMADPQYHTLALVTVLYVVTHIAQGRVAASAARAAISLRFENLDLIERLRGETDKAQAAYKAAEEANLAKSKFLAAASHDLRQPIHALGLFLEVIGRGELSAIQREMLENARGTSLASADMLNTLLDFSRIEAGVIQPQVQPVAIQTLLTKIESEMAPQAMVKGLFYRSRERHCMVDSDPGLLDLVLRNLVSNAIRYTRQGGVLVACRKRGDSLVLEVWDTGIGIEANQQQEIFREFHQLGNPERDRNKGLGLGLAIVDRLVRTLGLELTLRSEPGRGSVFKLKLPLSRSPIDVAGLTKDEAYQPQRRLSLAVLVIEDDEAIRLGMAQLLQDWGCACAAVESIDLALEAAGERRPDVVISDYRLRDQRTGAQAIQALRAKYGADLPALLITGDTAPERLREAQATGVPLLHKPVLPALLYQSLYQIEVKLQC